MEKDDVNAVVKEDERNILDGINIVLGGLVPLKMNKSSSQMKYIPGY